MRTTTQYVHNVFAEECRNKTKKTRRTLKIDRSFFELIILVVKGNSALYDVQRFSLYDCFM